MGISNIDFEALIREVKAIDKDSEVKLLNIITKYVNNRRDMLETCNVLRELEIIESDLTIKLIDRLVIHFLANDIIASDVARRVRK